MYGLSMRSGRVVSVLTGIGNLSLPLIPWPVVQSISQFDRAYWLVEFLMRV
jgi:hypothetical protein